MEVGAPLDRVVDEVPAHRVAARPVEVERRAPRSAVPVGEVRSVLRKDVALGTQVVVDDVEYDGEAARVGGVDQSPEPVGAAVARLGCVGEHAVVAPVARPGELGDGHELDRRDPQVGQRVETVDGRVERARVGEGPDVQLVDHIFAQRAPPPPGVRPREVGIDHRGLAVDSVGLGTRRGIGELVVGSDCEPVARTGPEPVDEYRVIAGGTPEHLEAAWARRGDDHLDAGSGRRPYRELDATIVRPCAQARHARSTSGVSNTTPSGGSVNVSDHQYSCTGAGCASTPPRLPTPEPP